MITIDVVSTEPPGARTPQPREQDDAARVVAPQTILEATKGVPAAPSGYIKECSCLPPLLTSQALLRGNWRSIAERLARACCPASLAGCFKLAFPRNALMQVAGMFDVILKFAVSLG
jgi:hypothetical protein